MSPAEMMKRITETSPPLPAKIAGLPYWIVMVGDRFAEILFAEILVRGRLAVPEDAAATAHNLRSHDRPLADGFEARIFSDLMATGIAEVLLGRASAAGKRASITASVAI
jgi:hypothetical protein